MNTSAARDKSAAKPLCILLALLAACSLTVSGCRLIQGDGVETIPDTTSQMLPPDTDTKGSQTTGPDDDQTSTASPTTTSTTTTTLQPTTVPTPDPTPAQAILPSLRSWTDAEIQGMASGSQGWYFNRPSEKGMDLPATLPQSLQNQISPYAVIWQLPSTGRKTVYLTMDEGYEYEENTTSILNTAMQMQVPITFFITDYFITTRPDLVERMAAEGHCVANHTMSHPDLAALLQTQGEAAVLAELKDLEKKYTDLTGRPLEPYIRPPMGAFSPRLLAVLNRAGYYPVFWSFAYRDWLVDDQPDREAALQLILDELHDGSVILIHAVSKTNVAILPELIEGIRARGYELAGLPGLIG